MTKILFICSSWPHGDRFGGQLRALNLARALQQMGPTSVLVVSSEANNKVSLDQTQAEFSVLPPILPLPTGRRSRLEKLRLGFDSRYLNLHGVAASPEDQRRIARTIEDFDLIWVLNSRTPNILNRWHWPRAHLDLDDVPSTYYRTLATRGQGALARLKAKLQQQLLKRRELRLEDRFNTLSVCSEADKRYLGQGTKIHVIPNGFPKPEKPPFPRRSIQPVRIGFIGLYSYAPNKDGVRWFLDNCWAKVRQAVPEARLRLIGKDSNDLLKPHDRGVDILGWVAEPTEEIASWSCMIVPIRFGGGTRIKIAEAFSRKCPAISTSIGAFGYQVENGKQLLLADHPDDFANACIRLTQTPDLGNRLADRAWSDYLEKWTWDAISPKIWTAAEDCLRRCDSQQLRS